MTRGIPWEIKMKKAEKSITEFAKILGLELLPHQEKLLEEISDSIHNGNPIKFTIDCTRDNGVLIRKFLQRLAGKYIDDGDPVRAQIALMEAKKIK